MAVALAAIVAGCVGAIVAFMLWQLRVEAWRTAETTAQNMVHLLRQDIERTFESYDLSLIGASEALALPGIHGVTPEIRQSAIFDRSLAAKYVNRILVLDRDGKLVLQSGSTQVPDLNNSDRDYFIAQRDRPDMGLYVSRPYISRLTGEPVIGLSRRLSNPDGSFNGVIVGNLRLSYFKDLLERLHVGPTSAVSIFRRDGTLLARLPWIEQDLGKSVFGSETYRRLTETRSGLFVGQSAIDKVRRLYAFEHLTAAPVFVDVALSTDDVLARWWRQAIAVCAIVIALCLAIIVLTIRSEREIRRRTMAEAQLAATADELARLSQTDALTGLANRRRFDELLGREIRRSRRTRRPLSLAILDADFFKAYNDRYGHPAGDEVLKTIAACIAGNLRRPGDVACRIGGEEFAVIMPDTPERGAVRIANLIRASLARRAVTHEASGTGCVTISVGVACTGPASEMDGAELYRVADGALYEAKHGGRNSVRLAEVEPARQALSA